MRIRRTLPIALAVVIVAAVVTLTVQLRKQAPPEPARLLPAADAFFYANLGWVRKTGTEKGLLPVPHDPEYERFIQETGFDFEHDLDSVAFAVHYPQSWPGGGTGGNAPEPRFSEVFIARFDTAKCTAYLKRTAQSVESYHSVEIYSIPLVGRIFRIAILGVDAVAASNHDDPAVIRAMVDRARRLASPFGGPAFLRHYYRRVQLASPVWLIARVEPNAPGFEGWSTVFPRSASVVISASYNPFHLPLRTGVLHLKAEASTDRKEDAQAIADKLTVFLAMFHSAEESVGSPASDADLKVLLDSLHVRQEDSRAVMVATVPTGVLGKLVDSSDQLPSLASPAQPNRPAPAKKH